MVCCWWETEDDVDDDIDPVDSTEAVVDGESSNEL